MIDNADEAIKRMTRAVVHLKKRRRINQQFIDDFEHLALCYNRRGTAREKAEKRADRAEANLRAAHDMNTKAASQLRLIAKDPE